jgi:hypothetical protein
VDDQPSLYLVSLRRGQDAALEHFAVRGTWDEVERLVQDVAWRYWQAGFVPLEVSSAEGFRRDHPDLADGVPRRWPRSGA